MTNPFKLPDDLTGPEEDLIAKAKAGECCFLFTDDDAEREYNAAPDGEKESVGARLGTRPGSDGAEPDSNVIRAIVIMHLALGGESEQPVHPKGVGLWGGWVAGRLDFEDSTLTRPLNLINCYIVVEPTFLNARSRLINLQGSHVPGLEMSGMTTEGPVFLRKGFEAAGEVNLIVAKIGGQLSCVDGAFRGKKMALNGNGMTTEGPVLLSDGFEATGVVSLIGAKIHGDLECSGGVFKAPVNALIGDRSEIGGHLFLSSERDADGQPVTKEKCRGFQAVGIVRFSGATIKGDLRCDGGQFGMEIVGELPRLNEVVVPRLNEVTVTGRVLMSASFHQDGTLAAESRVFEARGGVRLDGARIQRDLRFEGGKVEAVKFADDELSRFRLEGARIETVLHLGAGSDHSPEARLNTPVDLRAATVGTLRDCSEAYDGLNQFSIRLDGFTYRRIEGSTDASERIAWLDRQPKKDQDADFKPQPYEQLAKTLRDMGHTGDAKRVAIRKQLHQREAAWLQHCARLSDTKRPRVSWWKRRRLIFSAHFRWWMSRLFGFLVGYGYRPLYAFLALCAAVIFGSGVFLAAWYGGVMVPNDSRVLLSDGWMECITQENANGRISATECWLTWPQSRTHKLRADLMEPPVRGIDFPEFNAFIYALDTFVPFVNLHQETNWIPDAERGPSFDAFGWKVSWGAFARFYLWLHILAGWFITGFAATSLTGLVKKDV